MLVDKQTGLPLRTETVSQSQSGGNVKGVNGVRIVTEMTDIKDYARSVAVQPADGLPEDRSGNRKGKYQCDLSGACRHCDKCDAAGVHSIARVQLNQHVRDADDDYA